LKLKKSGSYKKHNKKNESAEPKLYPKPPDKVQDYAHDT
jgi:hypothetical protein